MLKWLHHGHLEFSGQLGIIDWIGKHYLIEKITFTSMPNICFHDVQIFWNNIFSVSSQGNSLTINILILMKKVAALNLSTFQQILYELLSHYANYLWLWFYVMKQPSWVFRHTAVLNIFGNIGGGVLILLKVRFM